MPQTLRYIILFVAVVLLQTLLLDNLNLSVYIYPMLYVAFIVLLPMEMAPAWVLLCAFLLGATIDAASGSAGLNTASLVAVAFARPLCLRLAVSKEERAEGGVPTATRLGNSGFLKYCFVFVLAHCFIYFSLEASTMSYFYLTAMRIVLSAVMTTLLVWVCQLFYR